jgi:hypothetical protein
MFLPPLVLGLADLGVGLMADDTAVTPPVPALAVEWQSGGELGWETRAFRPDEAPESRDLNTGLFGRLYLEARGRDARGRIRGWGRAERTGGGRSRAVLEEAWLEVDLEPSLSVRAGVDVLNWSTTEAFHPGDIVNARNLDSDVERYEPIGEPMVALTGRWRGGGVTGYFFPYRVRPLLPAVDSRLYPIPRHFELGSWGVVDSGGLLVTGRFGPQGAVRLRQTIGAADLTLHAVHHVDRTQPDSFFDAEEGRLRPVLRSVTQVGGSYEHVMGRAILKAECVYRWFVPPADDLLLGERDHLIGAAGLEIGWQWGRAESTLFAEAQSIFLADEDTRRDLAIFQRDAYLGYRLALGDTASTTFSAGAIMDLETTGDWFINASATRRFLNDWELAVLLRLVLGQTALTAVTVPADADHVGMSVRRYF